MPKWRFADHEVTVEEVQRAIDGVSQACFHCGLGKHRDDCPIMILLLELAMLRDDFEIDSTK